MTVSVGRWVGAADETPAGRSLLLILLVMAAVLGSAGFAALLVLTGGLSVVGLVTWIAVVAIVVRPRLGLYTVFALMLLFEAGGADPLMVVGEYLHGGLTGTAGISGAVATPLELLLLVMLASWGFQAALRRDVGLRGTELALPVLALTVALLAGLARGALAGGDMYLALFEARYLFYVPICYLVAAATLRTLGHVRALLGLALVGNGLFAVEGAYRRLALIETGRLGAVREFNYSHESVILLASALLLVLGLVAFGVRGKLLAAGLAVSPVIVFTMLAAERRAGFVALLIGFLALSIVLFVVRRRAFALVAVPLLACTAVYLPLFWNDTGLIGQPARSVRSVWVPDARDASSNTARLLETINVSATIAEEPLLGVGFGREYRFVVAVPDLSWWPLWHFVSHNNVLWLWLKLGALGFLAFWMLMGAAISRAVQHMRPGMPAEGRAFAAFALAAVVTTLVFSYVDIALLSGRITVFLGVILGALAALDRIASADRRPQTQ